jgi:ubiquinone/menaquinone biosynthesis C-methylase UbiE
LIPQSAWARRLVYELIYAWPGTWRSTTFNVGMAPADAFVLADPQLASNASQIQLYAELFSLAPWNADQWRQSAVLEIAAGCGGGMLYVSRRYRPREAIGIDFSAVAAWRGRRLGLDFRRGEATQLAFEDGRFDCLACVEVLNYLAEEPFIREARRVLSSKGLLLLAETSATFKQAEERFGRLAQTGGMAVDTVRDVSDAVRRSIRERSTLVEKALSRVPSFVRPRVAEMLAAEGSERYRRWQQGSHCFAMAVLRRA